MGGGQPAANVHGLGGGGQGVVQPTQIRQVGAEVGQRPGEVGFECGGGGGRQPAVDLDGLAAGGQGVLPPALVR
jgi:hypothetical protein